MRGTLIAIPSALLCSLLFSLLPRQADANGGGYQDFMGWTGSFSPRGIEDLEMLSEDLEIRFGYKSAEVKVKYQIRNEGPARSVEIGFPVTSLRWTERGEENNSWFPVFRLENYEIRKDGTPVESKAIDEGATTPQPEIDEDIRDFATWVSGWQVSELNFGANETSEIEVSFRAKYSEEGFSVSEDIHSDRTNFSYTLSSAAAWKGPIGKGTIRLIVETPFPEEFSIRSPKDRFTKNGNEYTWEFSNLEPGPADDLAISVYQPYKQLYTFGGDESGAYYSFRGNRYFFDHFRYKVTASSQLPDQKENNYSPDNVKAFYNENAWVEGVDGDGIGEYLTLTVDEPKPLHHILITPGYVKSDEAWIKNNRVAKLNVTLNGEKTFTAEFPDSREITSGIITIPDYDKPVSEVKLEIADVYRGEAFRDTCISRVALGNEIKEKPEVQGAR